MFPKSVIVTSPHKITRRTHRKIAQCKLYPNYISQFNKFRMPLWKRKGVKGFFNHRLNDFHSSLPFTLEKKDNSLPFLDVHVDHKKVSYETKVNCKYTFTGQHLRWESFTPIKRKASLVSTLVHRSLKICFKNKLK